MRSISRPPWKLLPAVLCCVAIGFAPRADAAVVVVSNRTERPVPLRLLAGDELVTTAVIAPRDSRPFFSDTPMRAAYETSIGSRTLPLAADSAYHFIAKGPANRTELRRLGLGESDQAGSTDARAWRRGAPDRFRGALAGPVPVLLCVDEDEPTRDALWRMRLTDRLAEASDVIERHSGVSFQLVGFSRWSSDNRVNDFTASLLEFEQEVAPPPGAIAIGFTSQYHVTRGPRKLGGTRGPLRRHVMLREFSPHVGERERVELLVHELGHFLGAAHSPEVHSVMRPVLGDRKARLKGYEIRFDAVNTLAIAMLGEEVRRRGARRFERVSAARRLRLAEIYQTLAQALPSDPAARVLLARAGGKPVVPSRIGANDLEGATARVVLAIAKRAAQIETADTDERSDLLVRAAAAAALNEPPEHTAKAFLIGIGFGLDDSDTLQKHPRTIALASGVESSDARSLRVESLGKPTARSRRDTLQHFAVMATLTATSSANEANLWGLTKEAIDAQGGTGYSFADLAANRAGVRFAERVLAGSLPLEGLARGFRVNNFVPPLDGLEEGLQLGEVVERYGGKGDSRFEQVLQEIDARIDRLPPYRPLDLGF